MLLQYEGFCIGFVYKRVCVAVGLVSEVGVKPVTQPLNSWQNGFVAWMSFWMCDNVAYHSAVLGFSLVDALSVRSCKNSNGHLAKFQFPEQFSLNSIRSSEVLLGYGAEMQGVKWTSSGHFL